MALDTLKVLEEKVGNVLRRQSALGEERDRLREELSAALAKIEAITGRLSEIEREREEVRARVDGLLERLDEIGV